MFARFAFLCAALVAGTSLASMDHYAPFATISWEADGGRTSITATQTKDGMTSLKVVAFGRTVEITQKDLEFFRSFVANGITVIGGPGSERRGGDHLTIEFSFRWPEDKATQARFVMVRSNGTYVLGNSLEDLLENTVAR